MYIFITIAIAVVILVIICIAKCPRSTKLFERYEHHGNLVWVRTDLKGKHRDHCLCFSCRRFLPGSDKNCAIAKRIYTNCIELKLVTPVWECPCFRQTK